VWYRQHKELGVEMGGVVLLYVGWLCFVREPVVQFHSSLRLTLVCLCTGITYRFVASASWQCIKLWRLCSFQQLSVFRKW